MTYCIQFGFEESYVISNYVTSHVRNNSLKTSVKKLFVLKLAYYTRWGKGPFQLIPHHTWTDSTQRGFSAYRFDLLGGNLLRWIPHLDVCNVVSSTKQTFSKLHTIVFLLFKGIFRLKIASPILKVLPVIYPIEISLKC